MLPRSGAGESDAAASSRWPKGPSWPRAYIRHRYTHYEQELAIFRGDSGDLGILTRLDDDLYHAIKGRARAEVDAFLEAHRWPPEDPNQGGQTAELAGWSARPGRAVESDG